MLRHFKTHIHLCKSNFRHFQYQACSVDQGVKEICPGARAEIELKKLLKKNFYQTVDHGEKKICPGARADKELKKFLKMNFWHGFAENENTAMFPSKG